MRGPTIAGVMISCPGGGGENAVVITVPEQELRGDVLHGSVTTNFSQVVGDATPRWVIPHSVKWYLVFREAGWGLYMRLGDDQHSRAWRRTGTMADASGPL